jgi:hypothetical protein
MRVANQYDVTFEMNETELQPRRLLTPDTYPAVITSAEAKNWASKQQVTYMKYILNLDVLGKADEALTTVLTTIRKEVTVGAINSNGELYSPNPEYPPIWGGQNGAKYVLSAAGVLRSGVPLSVSLANFTVNQLVGRVVRVMTNYGGYIRGVAGEYDRAALDKLFLDWNGVALSSDPNEAQIQVKDWNIANGYPEVATREKPALTLKNVATGFFKPMQQDIDAHDFVVGHLPEGNPVVFQSEAQYLLAVQLHQMGEVQTPNF